MAKSDNLLTNGFRGSLNKQIVFRQVGGKTIISSYPDFKYRKLSKKQLETHENMKAADLAARTIMADKAQRDAALIRLNVTSNKLYTSLISEYFRKLRQPA